MASCKKRLIMLSALLVAVTLSSCLNEPEGALPKSNGGPHKRSVNPRLNQDYDYSQADNNGGFDYSQDPVADKDNNLGYSQDPVTDNDNSSGYSQDPIADKKDGSDYSQGSVADNNVGSSYSQSPVPDDYVLEPIEDIGDPSPPIIIISPSGKEKLKYYPFRPDPSPPSPPRPPRSPRRRRPVSLH